MSELLDKFSLKERLAQRRKPIGNLRRWCGSIGREEGPLDVRGWSRRIDQVPVFEGRCDRELTKAINFVLELYRRSDGNDYYLGAWPVAARGYRLYCTALVEPNRDRTFLFSGSLEGDECRLFGLKLVKKVTP